MLQPESREEINGGDFRWYDLRHNCHINRTQILELLLQQVAARQGGAKKILAVDAVRLLDALDDAFKSTWCIKEEFPEGPSEFRNTRYHIKELSGDNPWFQMEEVQIILHDNSVRSWTCSQVIPPLQILSNFDLAKEHRYPTTCSKTGSV